MEGHTPEPRRGEATPAEPPGPAAEAMPAEQPESRAAERGGQRRVGWRDWALLFLIFLVGMISARACRGG